MGIYRGNPAALLGRRHFENRGALTIESKGSQDHVSEADRAVGIMPHDDRGVAAAAADDGGLAAILISHGMVSRTSLGRARSRREAKSNQDEREAGEERQSHGSYPTSIT